MILAEGAPDDTGLWLAVLALSLVTMSLLLLRWRRQRRVPLPAAPRKQMEDYRRERDLRRSGNELLIQLEEMARRISAQVDTKFAKLDRVIVDADERIARLETILAKAEELGGPRRAEPEAPALPAKTGVALRAAGFPRSPVEPPDPRHQNVYDLADAGTAPVDIAERLDMPLGEVEVILNLRSFR